MLNKTDKVFLSTNTFFKIKHFLVYLWDDFFICLSLTLDCIFFLAILPAQEWKPPLPAYNFLRMMDAAASQHPTRKEPQCMRETNIQENNEEQHKDKSTVRKESRIKDWERSNVFKADESFRHDNKEL